MRENIGFLKTSRVILRIAAWIFLVIGSLGAITIIFELVPGNPRWLGFVILAFYAFIFFLLFLIAKITDLLIRIISAISGPTSVGNDINKK